MKLILTHKKQLKQKSDVTRFLGYCYGKSLSRPVVPVEGYIPGLPTGEPQIDAQSLLSSHHGGKASKARSIAFSSSYFSSYEEAVAHAPVMPRVMSAFRANWASKSNAISIVHLTEGDGERRGLWRLDGHLIVANSNGKTGIQWNRKQCQQMQDFAWLPASLSNEFGIQSGKGKGATKRTSSLPYPKAKLIAFEVGRLTDYELETHLKSGTYGAARRAKTGRIISVEVAGKRINIQRARQLVAVRGTPSRIGGVLSQASTGSRVGNGGVARAGVAGKRNPPLPARRVAVRLGRAGKRGRIEDDFLFQGWRGLSGHNSARTARTAIAHCQRILDGHGDTFPVAVGNQARAGLATVTHHAQALIRELSTIESVSIFR